MTAFGEKTVLVLQGGGALGAYQAGAYEALCDAGYMPTWLAGISIGAINSAIIAGNPPDRRVARVARILGARLESPAWPGRSPMTTTRAAIFNETSAALVAVGGVPGFFDPRVPPAPFMPPGTPEAISVYDTPPLQATLHGACRFRSC